MRVRSAEDFDAIRFDIDIIEFETALLTADSEVAEKIQERILEKVNELPLTLNQVRAKETAITKIKTPKFWKDASFETLEAARQELRGLMRHRTRAPQDIEKLDIADQIIIRDTVEFGPEMERASTDEYRRKVEERVKALLATNDVLKKLKAGEELDEYDVEQLTKLLRSQDPYVTEELLQRVYDNHTAKFIDFICHILGLKKLQTRTEVISKEFDDFIAEHNDLKADQIQFLMLIMTFILDRGVIEREDLIGPPFTNIHPQGIRGIFPPAQLNAVMALIQEIGQLPR